MNKEIKVGDKVTPKDYPQLKSKVKRIKEFLGENLYVLENGTHYTKNELK